MNLTERQQQLDALLLATHDLWHPQPFKELRPAWCERWPDLTERLLSCDEAEADALNSDGNAALEILAGYLPELSKLFSLQALPALPSSSRMVFPRGNRWAWEIPGRKLAQIEAFMAKAGPVSGALIEWCGGKGHLGRLACLCGACHVRTLEVDAQLCAEGQALARRAGASQQHEICDVLAAPPPDGDAVFALHACGELHRHLVRQASPATHRRLAIAPCCYHKGMASDYSALTPGLGLQLTMEDARLAVTEAVTAAPREIRHRERERAWKLGFDAWRRASGATCYRSFKPVPSNWMNGSFTEFMHRLAQREGLSLDGDAGVYESAGWQRWHEVKRLSIARHAFRQSIEVWLLLDLAVALAQKGYRVAAGRFCDRQLTPRNLMLIAEAP